MTSDDEWTRGYAEGWRGVAGIGALLPTIPEHRAASEKPPYDAGFEQGERDARNEYRSD